MAMSDCNKCWETPCVCGEQGYTVIKNTNVTSEEAEVMVETMLLSNIMDDKTWEVIKGLSKLDTDGKNHLTQMKEYHMLMHLRDRLVSEVDKRSCKILNDNIDIDAQCTKLNNKLKEAKLNVSTENEIIRNHTAVYTIPKFEKGDSVIKINNTILNSYKNPLLILDGTDIKLNYNFNDGVDEAQKDPISFEWNDVK